MKLRVQLVMLICVAMPYSATATMLQSMQCHHDGWGEIATASHEGRGDHRMHKERNAHGSDEGKVSRDDGRNHAAHCVCKHHCTSSSSAAFTAAIGGMPMFDSSVDHDIADSPSHARDVLGRSVFRPPIKRLPSAA